MITVQRISSAKSLETLENEWAALVDREIEVNPFHRPQWLLPWWRRFGSGEMHVLAFRCGERLAGLIGLFIHEWSDRRQVTLIGNGITDYLGLIAEPAYAEECARLTYEYLDENSGMWDVCDWQDLEADSALISVQPASLHRTVAAHTPCTRAELPADGAVFEASLPHGLRRTIRLAARRLEREGELRFETVRSDADGDLVRELFRLHESRWAIKGGPESMLDDSAVQQFLIESTQRFSSLGKLRLYTLRYRGELAAMICGIFDGGRLWGYITGMDPALSRYSPGSLVLNYAMRDAIREGATAWEFLRGVEDYKFLWGARRVPKLRMSLWHSGQHWPRVEMAQALALAET